MTKAFELSNEELESIKNDMFKNKTVWKNVTLHTIKFQLGTNELNKNGSFKKVSYVLKPGDTAVIDSRYDEMIREINPHTGNVCGGIAPQLLNNKENPELNRSIRSDLDSEEEELMKIQMILEKERKFREAKEVVEFKKRGRKPKLKE